ncbi:uncharacterized protein LOC134289648 [Aedes albopictus]|uniref:CCHC-type domain-containing protein n=1 Tax=Aedes albopictus TaxID=7160 RepID=A0ABM1YH94_AEDAL
MTSDLRNLVKRERQLFNSLEGTERFLENYDATKDQKQISIRIQVLDSVYSEFFEVRRKTELLLDTIAVDGEEEIKPETEEDQQRKNLAILSDFEDRYFIVKAGLLELSSKFATTADEASHANNAAFPKVKLPEIKLPVFSGKVRDWITFRDSFRSLIDGNFQLTEMDKFSYLRSSLSGEALQEISSVEISAANYSVAWQALEARYENKKLIVKAHIDALFAVDGLRKESYDGLNRLISEFEKNLQMLDKIGERTADWSTLLVHMVCSRLDPATLRHWETHHNSKNVPTYHNLITFLRNHCAVLQSVVPPKSSQTEQKSLRPTVCQTVFKSSGRCPFCNETWHSAFHCAKFQRMRIAERNEAVTRAKLCRNCFNPGHYARTCERGECHHCHQKHHSMLHGGETRSSVPNSQSRPPTQPQRQQQPQSSSARSNQQTQNTNTATSANSQNTHTRPTTEQPTTSQNLVSLPVTPTQNILLSTALVKIHDRFGKTMLARALLDSCSQHYLMSKNFSSKLSFREIPSHLSVQGIGPSQSVSTKAVTALVEPRTTTVSEFSEEMQFHVLPKLTISLPTAAVDSSKWNLPPSMTLADPCFHEPGPIDLIIGAEYYMDLLCDERQKVTSEGPTLQNTVFGWIVSGRIPDNWASSVVSVTHVCSTAEIQDQLTKFWELETCRTASTHSTEESACEEIFDKTTTRDSEGRFVVALPKKEHLISQLGESRAVAIRRFMGMERRFATNPALKEEYTKFIREYEDLGHMEQISGDSIGEKEYYLPHHAVLKPESTTTKLRVVFDASCRTSSGVSLNEALMVGPVVQDDIQDISLRFRLHRYALVGDVAKMYRMVLHTEDDRRVLKIVWRDESTEPIRTYQLKTVTYGTASAPYLATKCLQRLLEEGESAYPVAAKVVGKDFYVDDMLSGIDSIDEGRLLIQQMIALLHSAGFTLRKWNSNSGELLKAVPEDLRDGRSILELESATATVKTLGLLWEPGSDQFKFSTPLWNSSLNSSACVFLPTVPDRSTTAAARSAQKQIGKQSFSGGSMFDLALSSASSLAASSMQSVCRSSPLNRHRIDSVAA